MPRPLQVILYGRPRCGLCDHAAALLERLARSLALEILYVDIESDAALEERYFLEIPVIVVDGEEIARAPISERKLEDRLRELLR